MCLAERERTEKEVWSSARKALRSWRDTCLISLRSFSNFLKFWLGFGGDFGAVVMLPLVNIQHGGIVLV